VTGNATVSAPRPGRRELAVILLAGAVGAAIVLLAARQEFARVEVVPLHPLPVTVTRVSGQDLLPATSALAVAVLASMAAVLATRGLLRRLTGLIAVLLGVGIAVTAIGRITKAAVLAAAGNAIVSPATTGAGSSPGSTTTGTDSGQATGSIAGFPSHVLFTGSAWRALMVAGAVLVVLAGLAVIARASRLPAMSGRYERAGQRVRATPAAPQAPLAEAGADSGVRTGQNPHQPNGRALLRATSAANMWESLTAGVDPTASGED
jgi:uncharacterized membrane protein (TIGR02234 family)